MFVKFDKYRRPFILIMAAIYVLTSSGVSTLAVQTAHDYYAHIIFPCKGNGCACDKAGYELRGCLCNHNSKENEISSCCSEETDQSCCSEEPSQSCCSETDETNSDSSLSPRGCQGTEGEESFQATSHLCFDLPTVEVSHHINNKLNCSLISKLSGTDLETPGKIPILS